ncbi:carbohydrate esterase family 4 protein [Guyanagaster necrorhizus]|uniref:chitin deacetylase n=1 Tax=Guyanagaster necrorhizus TaxID=856835 RepID=A0A9P8ANK6_9AGAR|nr:carbohydrate esterase family 4 protein [Guyanagaster necrorhizus MCA 3950]KAG7441949.1 carbohydrate esterase family 4 protein [Guyanagaster necrorhizus MCA 3950]
MSLFYRSFFAIFSLGVLLQGARGADRSSEEAEAAITGYSLPSIWQPATILPDDAEAQAKWQSISGSIPTNISGTPTGDFSDVSYPTDDPDCWWTNSKCVIPKLQGLPPDVASVPEPLTLGYGFDDGPNCSHNAFYDYLTSQDQKATMFYIGSNVMNWPLEAQRAITDGHEVCVHTWSHRYMTALASEDAFAELYYKMQAINLVTGVTPKCWRPPFGDVDDRIRAIANALDLQTVIWKYDSNDWKVGTDGVTAETVDGNYQSLVDNAENGTFSTEGAIMLTHELNNYTMATAIQWYPQLKAAFKYIVPIAVALNNTQPYVETDYPMPSFEQYISGETTITNSSDSDSTSTSISDSADTGTETQSGSASTSELKASSTSTGQASATKQNGASLVSPDIGSSFWVALAALGYLTF